MNQKRLWLSDIYFHTADTKIKIVDSETGEAFIFSISERQELENLFEFFQSPKDVHTIGFLQALAL